MYIATKHIGNKYTPGEILPDDLPADMVDWLKEAGAIRETAPAPAIPPRIENLDKKDEYELALENHKRQLDALGYNADGTPKENMVEEPKGEAASEADEEAAAEDAEDEIDEETEAPEIDVMDGIVAQPKEETKPARATPRKTNTSRTAKGGKRK